MSQKIPLFAGVPLPIAAGAPTIINPLFTPPDLALPAGTQSRYELNLWWTQGAAGAGTGDFVLSAYPTGVPADAAIIYFTRQQAEPARPIQVLRNYPIRGGIVLTASIEAASAPQALFGYYRRVGGEDDARERRFIGVAGAGFAEGVPLRLAPGETKVFHTFEDNRIDVLSLAVMQGIGDANVIIIRFEDASNNVLASWQQTAVSADPSDVPVGILDPYLFRDVPFGGGVDSLLDHISVVAPAENGGDIMVYGDYWRS